MMVDRITLVHLKNRGDKRSGQDRRKLSVARCFPGKRSGQDRRTGPDRRSEREGVATTFELEIDTDESVGFLRSLKGFSEAFFICLLLWGGFIISMDFVYGKIVSAFMGAVK